MTSADAPAGDFDPRFFESFSCLGGLLGQILDPFRTMSGRPGPGWRGGLWDRGFGQPRGSREWRGGGPGGFGGPWGGWWPGPPGAPRGPKAGRGDVRAAILALLREGPRNGYQIMSEIEERSGGAWRPSPGAVYPALQQLADEGLIEAEESAGRRTFSLTDAGRRHIEENPKTARAAWESMAGDEAGEVPSLFIQAARLGGSIVQMAHAGTPDQIHAAEQLLEQTRSRMYQILAGEERGEQDEQQDEQ
ncbi:MAG TPA: PadR family transcriptional regulator [Streptosporangiaceae bacterium]|nr:PadR family transcriptional regulator [Streptosporangiaceae bacterium]